MSAHSKITPLSTLKQFTKITKNLTFTIQNNLMHLYKKVIARFPVILKSCYFSYFTQIYNAQLKSK